MREGIRALPHEMTNYDSVQYRSLAGKGIVITGGASGIGAAMVEAFAAQGARVDFLDIDEEAAKVLTSSLDGKPVRFHRCDVTDIASLRRTLAAIEDGSGAIETLVNNAARDDRHAFERVEPGYWNDNLAVNLNHQFFATQAVAPAMAKRGSGSIILLGSVAWMRGRPGLVAYTTAKAAINGLTRTLARELGESGIRVNCIVPGAIATHRQARLWRTPALEKEFLERQALKLRLDASHVARMALFLASDEAAGCTAQNFIVDAGITVN
jgi:NAD(P)-dependent dehydrogenase (short-subunit alcohol dehydrogenase family)